MDTSTGISHKSRIGWLTVQILMRLLIRSHLFAKVSFLSTQLKGLTGQEIKRALQELLEMLTLKAPITSKADIFIYLLFFFVLAFFKEIKLTFHVNNLLGR